MPGLKIDTDFLITEVLQKINTDNVELNKAVLLVLLENAISLEHFTIPPYLTALFSIKPGTNKEVATIFYEIVKEEMLHMLIASNLYIVYGGEPKLSEEKFFPKYPGKIPLLEENVGFEVSLQKASKKVIKDTFMEIEKPENPLHFDVKNSYGVAAFNYPTDVESEVKEILKDVKTIGSFYKKIIAQINLVPFTCSESASKKQLIDEKYFGEHNSFHINTRNKAIEAINIIIEQGEGTDTGPEAEGEFGSEIAHYYRFAEIFNGKKLVKDEKEEKGYSYSGSAISFNENEIINLTKKPLKRADLTNYPKELDLIDRFNREYHSMLINLEQSFVENEEQKKFNYQKALNNMHKLRVIAVNEIVKLENPIEEGTFLKPTFEYPKPKLLEYKIYPPIGVARLGNHESEYFIGPEQIGTVASEFFDNSGIPLEDDKNFKSADLKIRRQAARFKVFACYDDGTFEYVKSTENEEILIEWEVKIANTKASAEKFHGIGTDSAGLRNPMVSECYRKLLSLSPDKINIQGINKFIPFEKVNFKAIEETTYEEKDIYLGECRTDSNGNLLVLGGHGVSKTVKENNLICDYANNDYWFDDMADGYVRAKVKIKINNTSDNVEYHEYQVAPAWVIIAPPDYSPYTKPLLNLYDTLYDRFLRERKIIKKVIYNFYNDIQPLLKATFNVKYLFKMPFNHDFDELINDPNSDLAHRRIVFNKLRHPDDDLDPYSMPLLLGSNYDEPDLLNKDQIVGQKARSALTHFQYEILQAWKEDKYDKEITQEKLLEPDELTKAALENCAGGGFFPGIETSYNIRDKYEFIEPFRLDGSKLEPGDLTKQNALPWQADFLDCTAEKDNESGLYIGWWPYSRPDYVYREDDDVQLEWAPREIFEPESCKGYAEMLEKWSKLGFVVEKDGKFIEVQREL